MTEVWLRTNRRALWFGTVPPLVLVAVGAWLTWGGILPLSNWPKWLGAAMIALGSGLVTALLVQMRRPRVAYDNGQVLFYLRTGPPLAVPVDLVEAFFIGQGPVMIPGASQHDVSVNLVARLSQRDPSYARREVKHALGAWCDGYVTIRGTWCEPIDGDIVRRLNRRLREVTEANASPAVSPA